MSYVTVYAFMESSGLTKAGEFRNGHGFAPFVWRILCQKYVGEGGLYDWAKLWTEKFDYEPYEFVVLQSTYDRAVICKSDIPKFVSATRKFFNLHQDPNVVCHLSEIADLAIGAAELPGFVALAFQNSVADEMWFIHEENDEDEARPYDLNRDTGHFFIDTEDYNEE